MMNDLFGLPEVLVGMMFFGLLAALGLYFANRGEASDDTRMFR